MLALLAAKGGPDTSAAPAALEHGQVAVPLKALAQPDDQEQIQTPGEGDTVSFTVDATIVRIDGDNAIVQPSAVNGQPINPDGDGEPEENEGSPEDEASDEKEGADLKSMASQM